MNFESIKNPKLLIIEDDLNLNILLSSILTKKEFDVSYETTLKDARVNLETNSFEYDIVLLDYHLPDGKGLDFLEWLKLVAPVIPVVFISADNDNTKIVKCFKAGAIDFIVKPFDILNVISILKAAQNKTTNTEPDTLEAEVYTQDWVELSATSNIDYLSRIQKLCSTLLSRELKNEIVEDIKLAMEEYGRNAIEWGNKFDKSKLFKISYCVFSDRIILKFEDEGDGFDLKSIPDPSKDPFEHLKSREEAGKRPGGYGIFMMKNIMDEVLYNDKGNACIMTKFL